MSNPLEPLAQAAKETAKGVVRSIVEGSFGPNTFRGNNQTGKTDNVFQNRPMDVLRRAAYYSVFDTLFLQGDKFPYINPDKTLKKVIGKLSCYMFPKGTTFKIEDDGANDLLQAIIEQTKFQLKTESIVTEAALMGYCGLRTVYDSYLQRWIYEVKPKEYLVIETMPGIPEEIVAIGMEWPIDRQANGKTKRFWKKERWTVDTYQVWREKPETTEGKPRFKDEDLEFTEPNNYGEIPYSIVPHFYDADFFGVGVVNDEEILTVKSLIRLRHKRHFGHLKYMDPNPVRKNHANPGEPLDMSIGNVIDLTQGDENMPVDLSLLEFAGMPDSVKDEFYDHVKALYEAAGLKAPPKEDVVKAGTDVAGVALRVLEKDDAETIATLRDNGYSQVLRHFEKILRMGKNLNLPEYSGINTEDPEALKITAKFPDFFPPTDADISLKLANMEAANLPADVMAPMVASLFGIEDPVVIQKIQQGIEDKRAALEPANPKGF
jgi:hypothetical protein